MTMHYQESDPIILGSGELYILEADKIVDPTKLTTDEEEKLINIGAIESGCTINISTEKKDVETGNRGIVARWVVKREVKLTTGVMTWVMENVAKYLLGADYEETKDADENIIQTKMTVGVKDSKPIYIRFIHNKRTGGQLIVNIYKATFDGDLSFVFDKDNPTSINYEFLAMPDKDKNYVEFIETFEIEKNDNGGEEE